MRLRRALLAVAVSAAALAAALVVAEIVARTLEPVATTDGADTMARDPVLGWVPGPGARRITTSEFSAAYDVNALGMNDRPVTPADRDRPVRVLALGDSHTYAVGVSRDEAWPLVLGSMLFGADRGSGRVFNGGVAAYNLGQYLLRFRALQPVIQPTLVIVGVSTATDLFDLLPPRFGGFVYGGDAQRTYFDLDGSGRLVERTFVASHAPQRRSTGFSVRAWLRRFALYRRVQNSMLVMRLATSVKLPGGDPVWDGPDAVLRRDLTEREVFQWALARAIVRRLADEARAANASVVLVLIPYVPEVYDEVWDATFGRSADYDRFIGGRRLAEIAAGAGAAFVDTTPALRDAANRSHRWLHYRIDKHPTAEGQRVIAETVAKFFAGRPDLVKSTQ